MSATQSENRDDGTDSSESTTTAIESRLYSDVDSIGSSAECALNALKNGDIDVVESHLEEIKQTAKSWEIPEIDKESS